MSQTFYVRLKPYDPLRRQVCKTRTKPWCKYVHGVWHAIDDDTEDNREALENLRKDRQIPTDDRSYPAFDVCTLREAQAIIAAERGAKLQQVVPTIKPERKQAPKEVVSKPATELNAPEPMHELETLVSPPTPVKPSRAKKKASVRKKSARRSRST